MDKLEKIERLRERANVTYEEAKDVLELAGEDVLDAMILLEKQGKVKKPQQSTYSTSYEQQDDYIRVKDKVEEQRLAAPSFGKTIGRVARIAFRFVTHSFFHITRKGTNIITVPSWVMALVVILSWRVAIPAFLISLLFGIRYSFEGRDGERTDFANRFLNRAGKFADDVQSGLHRDDNEM